MSLERDLELLYEVGCLRFIQRTWKQFLGPDFANLTEHHLRVIWLSLLLAKMENAGNQEKIIKMALVHDLTESRTGDVHHISRQYTKRNEAKAVKDIFKDTSLRKEMVGLCPEYEKKKSTEAKIVKDADYLDVDLELQEQKAIGRRHFHPWDSTRKIISEKLHTKSGKQLWQAIQKSDPSDWFGHARTRFNSGDMKPKHPRTHK